jgi:plastocyanin
MSMKNLMKLPVLGLLALAAACGGGDDQAAPADAPAATGAPTVEIPAQPAADAQGAAVTPDEGREVVEVRMVTTQGGASGVFEPAQVTVRRGDVVRWIQADAGAAHNVSFRMAQGNPPGFQAPADSPYYTQEGQTFELKIDWEPGTYNYVCVPHMATGMVGSITVTE